MKNKMGAIRSLGETKMIAMRLVSENEDGINPGMVWKERRITYSNAEKAIKELEKEGKLVKYTKDDTTFWEKKK